MRACSTKLGEPPTAHADWQVPMPPCSILPISCGAQSPQDACPGCAGRRANHHVAGFSAAEHGALGRVKWFHFPLLSLPESQTLARASERRSTETAPMRPAFVLRCRGSQGRRGRRGRMRLPCVILRLRLAAQRPESPNYSAVVQKGAGRVSSMQPPVGREAQSTKSSANCFVLEVGCPFPERPECDAPSLTAAERPTAALHQTGNVIWH